jgi:hypothetical protein
MLAATLMLGKAEAKTNKKNPVVEVNVPFAFQVGSRTLPAGDYQFEMVTGAPEKWDTMAVVALRNRNEHVYQAIAVPVSAGAGLAGESWAVFGGGDQHVLVALWQNGDRYDIRPTMLLAAQNGDEWNDEPELVSVAMRSELH